MISNVSKHINHRNTQKKSKFLLNNSPQPTLILPKCTTKLVCRLILMTCHRL